MKNKNGFAKLLALGTLTITISITTVSGGKITASVTVGDMPNIVRPISHTLNTENIPEIQDKFDELF